MGRRQVLGLRPRQRSWQSRAVHFSLSWLPPDRGRVSPALRCSGHPWNTSSNLTPSPASPTDNAILHLMPFSTRPGLRPTFDTKTKAKQQFCNPARAVPAQSPSGRAGGTETWSAAGPWHLRAAPACYSLSHVWLPVCSGKSLCKKKNKKI